MQNSLIFFFLNAYKLELPKNLNISLIFNVDYLYEFHEHENRDESGVLDG